jgi:hypothetical protein
MEKIIDLLANKCYLPLDVVEKIIDNGFDDMHSL